MDEYNEIINKLKNMGIYCWIESGQVVFGDIPICEQNETLNDINIQEYVSQEYDQQNK